jgi:formate dehydrogenase major subunit
MGEDGIQLMDRTLQDPRCVFQLLRQHYARYDLETGQQYHRHARRRSAAVYTAMASTGRPDRRHHHVRDGLDTAHPRRSEHPRCAIIQTLLGNMGMAGGGINALRGESNVQGSTDHGLLFHILPGYWPPPGQVPDLAPATRTT